MKGLTIAGSTRGICRERRRESFILGETRFMVVETKLVDVESLRFRDSDSGKVMKVG